MHVDTGLVTNYSVLSGPDPLPKVTGAEREEGRLIGRLAAEIEELEWVLLPHYKGGSGSIRTPCLVNDADQEESGAFIAALDGEEEMGLGEKSVGLS
jgi:hypothetical protein